MLAICGIYPIFGRLLDNTEVELHWRAQAMTSLFLNRKLQKWLEEHQEEMFNANASINSAQAPNANDTITTPSAEFNAFYILLHCYHHMFESGLGLRQLMDYCFVLRTQISVERSVISDDLLRLLKEFGMMKFAKGVMWIMGHVFRLEREYMLCEPDECEGRFLLKEVMMNGNFGHHDERKHHIHNKWIEPFITRLQHNWHLIMHYPSEFFWAPIWLVYHYIWKRTKKC